MSDSVIDLDNLLDEVNDRDSFLIFVKALIKDREEEVASEKVSPSSPYGSGANGWENGSIESYLDAAVACVDGNEPDKILAETPTWNSFAKFLLAGKYYE